MENTSITKQNEFLIRTLERNEEKIRIKKELLKIFDAILTTKNSVSDMLMHMSLSRDGIAEFLKLFYPSEFVSVSRHLSKYLVPSGTVYNYYINLGGNKTLLLKFMAYDVDMEEMNFGSNKEKKAQLIRQTSNTTEFIDMNDVRFKLEGACVLEGDLRFAVSITEKEDLFKVLLDGSTLGTYSDCYMDASYRCLDGKKLSEFAKPVPLEEIARRVYARIYEQPANIFSASFGSK